MLNPITANAVTAATKCGAGDITVLVAGTKCGPVSLYNMFFGLNIIKVKKNGF